MKPTETTAPSRIDGAFVDAVPTGRRTRLVAAAVMIAAGTLALPAATGTVHAEDPGIDCAEWDAAVFTVDATRTDATTVELSLTYDDSTDAPLDVCPYTIFFSLRTDDGASVVSSGLVGADDVAAATEQLGSFDQSMSHDDCDWEVHVAVEESLPIVLDSAELCLGDLRFRLEPLIPIRPVLPPIWASSFAFAR